MRRLWLLFAQTVTVALALWFIVATLKPEWLTRGTSSIHLESKPVSVQEAAGSDAAPSQGSYREAARRAMPAVVNIFTTKEARSQARQFNNDPFFRRFFGEGPNTQDDKQFSLGSGVIVSSEGYILTNDHVIDGAEEMEVALADGRKVPAKLVGSDPDTDLAVIKVNLKNLPSITLGRLDNAKVGDVVLAIGNPFGVGQTVTMGIISALGRNHLGINTFENFIQTDAAINPGNSGGALVDTNGHLLGINNVIYTRSGGSLGIGFAIPVTTVKTVMDAIIRNGQVVRGWIGVEPQDITPELAENFGLQKSTGTIIAGVLRGGPADKAGVKPGDILLSVADKPVSDTVSMLNLVAQLTPGEKVRLTVLRKSSEAAIDITVGRRPRSKSRRPIESE
jgi:serine protease DegQ